MNNLGIILDYIYSWKTNWKVTNIII